jgi:tetratricopeptide (TPR) repeat protein
MIAWWSGDRTTGDVEKWLDAAHQRLTPRSSTYLRLFSDYFTARSSGQSTRGPINAMLDLRPHAWVLHYARAHDQLAGRELAGALRSLQQIPLDIPDAAQVAEVLTDRRSLGDESAEPLAAQNTAINNDLVLAAYVRGRMAYSRGDLADSIAAFDRCRVLAEEQRQYSRQGEATLFAALAALEAGTADAGQRVDATVRLAHEQNIQSWEAAMLGLQAFLEAKGGNADRASTTLARAWTRNPNDWMQAPLLLIAFENGLPAPADTTEVVKGLSDDPVFGGVAELLLGWQAWAHNDLAQAKRQLALAREHGIAQTYHAEDAALLAARLGEAPVACRVDPPYPNQLRLSACISLREIKKS